MMMTRIATKLILQTTKRPVIQRRWVETADPRCPLACVWFALGRTQDAQPDVCESDRPWPALLRGGQAFLPALHHAA
jgi:hypothetical protein